MRRMTNRSIAFVLLASLASGCGAGSPSPPLPSPERPYEYAVAVAERARSMLPPSRALPVYHLGRTHERFGRADEALIAYREALRLDSSLADAWSRVGAILSPRSECQAEAIDAYQAALRCDWGRPGLYTRFGLVLERARRVDDAIDAFEAEIRLGSDDGSTHRGRAHALAEAGRHDEAVASYRKALELEPRQRAAYDGIIRSLQTLGRPDDAQGYRTKLDALGPQEDAADVGGDADAAEGDAAQQRRHVAATWLDAARAFLDERNRAAVRQDTAAEAGFRHEALEAADRAIEFEPASASAHGFKIRVLAQQAPIAAVVGAARAFARAAPTDPDASWELAERCLEAISPRNSRSMLPERRAEFVGEADAALARTLELRPSLAAAHFQRARLLLFEIRDDRRWAAALDHATRARALVSEPTPEHFDVLAYAHIMNRDGRGALRVLEEGVQRFPSEAGLRQRLEKLRQSMRGRP